MGADADRLPQQEFRLGHDVVGFLFVLLGAPARPQIVFRLRAVHRFVVILLEVRDEFGFRRFCFLRAAPPNHTDGCDLFQPLIQ